MPLFDSPKPPNRNILRMLSYLRFGSSRAHWQEWLPGIALDVPDGHETGHISYRGQPVCELLSHASIKPDDMEECVVVGTGPSIGELELSRLHPNSAMLLNGAISLIETSVEKPFAVVIEDERFIWRHFDMMRALIPDDQLCYFSAPVLRAICEKDIRFLKNRHIALIDNLIKPFNHEKRAITEFQSQALMTLSEDGLSGFSRNSENGVFPAGTVAFSAFQIAATITPARIGFAGIDLSADHSNVRFYEGQSRPAWSGVARAHHQIMAAFSLGASACKQAGIELVNYSEASALQQLQIPYSASLKR